MENEEKEVDNCEMEKKEVIFGRAGDDSIDEDESTEEETWGFALLIHCWESSGWVGRLGGVDNIPTTYIQLTVAGSMVI